MPSGLRYDQSLKPLFAFTSNLQVMTSVFFKMSPPPRLLWLSLVRNSYVICWCKSDLHVPANPNYYLMIFENLIYICEFDILKSFVHQNVYVCKVQILLAVWFFTRRSLRPYPYFHFSPCVSLHGRTGPVQISNL